MYIRSTGLGKTLLQCKVANVESCNIVIQVPVIPPDVKSDLK